MTCFLDVGSHDGQTLAEVIKSEYGFSDIYAFEPMPVQYRHLQATYGHLENVHLLPYGLWDREGQHTVYGDNSRLEASMFPTKVDVDESVATKCLFLNASKVVSKFADPVVMKLNVEGAEVKILHNLLDSGAIFNCESIMVDFDCVKIPGQEHQKQETIDWMNDAGFDRYCLAEDVMVGNTHGERISYWLHSIGLDNDGS